MALNTLNANNMNKFIFAILLACLLGSGVRAQPANRHVADQNYYRGSSGVNMADIRAGKQLQLAKELTVEEFMGIYLQQGKRSYHHKHEAYLIFDELYRDKVYTYFGIWKNNMYLIDFYKVASKDLEHIDVEALDGNALKQQFVEEVIPAADKVVETKKSGTNYRQYTFTYNKAFNRVDVVCKWMYRYRFFFSKDVEKVYAAKYNLQSMRYEL